VRLHHLVGIYQGFFDLIVPVHVVSSPPRHIPLFGNKMEPLSALSIATAVVQFLDFAGKVVSGTSKIYKGQRPEGSEGNSDIRIITVSLNDVTKKLQSSRKETPLKPWSSQDAAIFALSERCTEVGGQLLTLLDRLRAQNDHRIWESFRIALRAVTSEKAVDKLCHTLDNYRQQISMHILIF
jgi:hypothetical protein